MFVWVHVAEALRRRHWNRGNGKTIMLAEDLLPALAG